METIISVLIVLLPSMFLFWSTNSDKQNSKSDIVAAEQLNKVYLPIQKMLSGLKPSEKSHYAEIRDIIADCFDKEYLLIDCVSKKKFDEFNNSFESDNLFTITLAYKELYSSIDYYYNSLKKQLGYPYKHDFRSIRYYYANNSRYRNSVRLSVFGAFVSMLIIVIYCFEIVDNKIVIREHTDIENIQYLILFTIMNIIYFFWNRLKK